MSGRACAECGDAISDTTDGAGLTADGGWVCWACLQPLHEQSEEAVVVLEAHVVIEGWSEI